MKYRLYIKKQKRKAKYLAFRYRYFLLGVLICVFFASVFMIRRAEYVTDAYDEAAPEGKAAISSVPTGQNVCAVTFNVTCEQDEKDVSLTFEVLGGLNVPAVCFADTKWLVENKEKAIELESRNIEFGLLFSKELDKSDREDVMLILAKENEKFYSVLSKYPEFVRVVSGSKTVISGVLQVFHQYDISYSVNASDKDRVSVSPGDICSLGYVSGSTPYIAARFIAGMISADTGVVSLKELIKSSEV